MALIEERFIKFTVFGSKTYVVYVMKVLLQLRRKQLFIYVNEFPTSEVKCLIDDSTLIFNIFVSDKASWIKGFVLLKPWINIKYKLLLLVYLFIFNNKQQNASQTYIYCLANCVAKDCITYKVTSTNIFITLGILKWVGVSLR